MKIKYYILLLILLSSFGCVSRHKLLLRTYSIQEWNVPATKEATLYIMAKLPGKKPEMIGGVGLENGQRGILYVRWDTDHDELDFKLVDDDSTNGIRCENLFEGSFRAVQQKKEINSKGATRLFESYDKKTYVYAYIKGDSQQEKGEKEKKSIEDRAQENSLDNNLTSGKDVNLYSADINEIVTSENKDLYYKKFKDEKWDMVFSEIERSNNYSIIKSTSKKYGSTVGAGLTGMFVMYEIAKLRENEYFFPAKEWKEDKEDFWLYKVYFFNNKDIRLRELLGNDYSDEAQYKYDKIGYRSVREFEELFVLPRKEQYKKLQDSNGESEEDGPISYSK